MESSIDGVFTALADPTRRRVVELLAREPLRVGELARRLETPMPAMSRHLRMLLHAGLVEDQRPRHDARLRVFFLRVEVIQQLESWRARVQADWDRQLRAFKEHAERRNDGPATGG